jgi:hypothetical protein
MRFNVYDDVKVLAGTSVDPVSLATTVAATGNKVDTIGGDNAAVYVRAAAASGSPATASLVVTLQESADGSTSWSNALDNTGVVIGFTLDAHTVAAENIARIEGLNLNRKRYLRAVITPNITAGGAVVATALIIIGNNQVVPVDTVASNT